jgi:hypothetical protein
MNGHGPKEYDGHYYADHDGTSDCKHGCGCWMGPTNSGGPTGLDPFGKCPRNPKDGTFIGGSADYDYVVTERIRNLESKVYAAEGRLRDAEERLKKVKPSKAKLADELASMAEKLSEKDQLLAKLRNLLGTST